MVSGRDIIVHGLQSLDSTIGSNCVNLAYEFSKNNRVLYVNYPMDRLTLWRRRKDPLINKRKQILSGKQPDLVKVTDTMWNLNPRTILESISKINNRPIFNLLNRINNKRYAKKVKEAIDKLGFKKYLIFNDSDFYRGLFFKELLNPYMCIYYTRDNMRATNFFKKNGAFYEDKLMAKSDLVVSNSVYLNNIAKICNPDSVYVGQGCDTSLFDKKLIKQAPFDIKGIKKPVIGYIGVLINKRLDIEVLIYIAQQKPDWSIVLVGPEDEAFENSDLHKLNNVHFLGSKKIEDLPAYLNSFDVALNPQLLNELTIGNYPRKIDEYLAMGKPTVATKTDGMSVFSDYVYLAENKEEYVELIQKAIDENTPQMEKDREAFARSHTWKANANEIFKVIEQIESRNK